jgi:hypothetical protein
MNYEGELTRFGDKVDSVTDLLSVAGGTRPPPPLDVYNTPVNTHQRLS